MIHPLAESIRSNLTAWCDHGNLRALDKEIRKWLEEKVEKLAPNDGTMHGYNTYGYRKILCLEPKQKWCEHLKEKDRYNVYMGEGGYAVNNVSNAEEWKVCPICKAERPK